LVLECYGSDHWLLPGETFVVWTVGSFEGGPWPGTTHGNEPFQADYSVLINVDFSEKTWSRRGRSVVRRTQEPYWLSSLGTAGKSDYPGPAGSWPQIAAVEDLDVRNTRHGRVQAQPDHVFAVALQLSHPGS